MHGVAAVQVDSGSVTAAGPVANHANAAQTLKQSLGVSDADANDLLALAADSGRPGNTEAAAWHFFEERRSLLLCLCTLLQIFLEYRPATEATVQHATTLLRHLVSAETSSGRPSLLASLVSIAQVCFPHAAADGACVLSR